VAIRGFHVLHPTCWKFPPGLVLENPPAEAIHAVDRLSGYHASCYMLSDVSLWTMLARMTSLHRRKR